MSNMKKLGRPKGSKQKRNESKYTLPDGIVLSSDNPEYYTKEAKLLFVDPIHGNFMSTFKDLQ